MGWEHRDDKLRKRRTAMKIQGRQLLTDMPNAVANTAARIHREYQNSLPKNKRKAS